MSYVSASKFVHEHQDWLSAIDFYKKEIQILQNRLTELASRNTGDEVMKEVEHFQNQFIVQRNNIDELRHDIKEHIHHAKNDAQKHAGKVEEGLVLEHDKVREEFDSLEKVINDLREEFKEFLAKRM